MSNFTDVWALNAAFQMAQTDGLSFDQEVLLKQLAVIREEFDELERAIKEKNWAEVKDATGDVLVTTYGMAYAGKFNADALMKNISESNFSKLCRTHEDAVTTSEYYTSLGVETFIAETKLEDDVVWAVKSAKDQSYTDESGEAKSIRSGKFLKNTKWTVPSLDVDI